MTHPSQSKRPWWKWLFPINLAAYLAVFFSVFWAASKWPIESAPVLFSHSTTVVLVIIACCGAIASWFYSVISYLFDGFNTLPKIPRRERSYLGGLAFLAFFLLAAFAGTFGA